MLAASLTSHHPLCRLNYRLSIACHDTIMNKCADACTSTSIDQPCGGTVLRCLTEKLDEITDAECKKEVFYFIKMEASLACLTHTTLGRCASISEGICKLLDCLLVCSSHDGHA